MDFYTLARILHVLSIVIWIGGVFMVTLVILPAVQRFKSPAEQIDFFTLVENRFALFAKITTTLALLSGLWMLYLTDGWGRFLHLSYWWLWAMVFIWLLFSLVLFWLEPAYLDEWFRKNAQKDPVATFQLVRRFHYVLLTLSLITIAGAVAGSHGWFWIG